MHGGRMKDLKTISLTVDKEVWMIDTEFLQSSWKCIWGNGCKGINQEPDPEAGLGCCSVGAQMLDADEAMLITAIGRSLPSEYFQNHLAAKEGVLNSENTATRLERNACIFLNHPDFVGGAGCALHLAAISEDERPMDYKPSVCWQLPLKVDRSNMQPTLRPWNRSDWGDGGDSIGWCCSERSESPESFKGEQPVFISLAHELTALVGEIAYAELAEQLTKPEKSL